MSTRIGGATLDSNINSVHVFDADVHEGCQHGGMGRIVSEPYVRVTLSANDGQVMRALDNRHVHTLDLRFNGRSWECKDLQVTSGPEAVVLDDGTAAIKVGFKAPHNAVRKF